MADWQVGDLALCVDASARSNPTGDAPMLLQEGRVYVVSCVTPASRNWTSGYEGPGLVLEGVKRISWNQDWRASRFHKIRPDQHEGDIHDWELLLDSVKRTVKA